jgi:uncharacterized protein involved in outer membrane biogenesis
VLWTFGGFAGLILAVVLFFHFFDWNAARPFVAAQASRISGRPVRIDGNLRVHLLTWTPTATVDGLWVGDPAWMNSAGALADVGRMTASVKLIPLITGHVEMPLVDLERADISLYRNRTGRENWMGDNPNPPPVRLPPIQRLIVHDGRVRLVDEKRRLFLTGTVESRETTATPNGQGLFALVGQGTLNRNPFSLRITGGSLLHVRHDQPYRFDADLTAGETHVSARGALLRPFDFGRVDAQMALRGRSFGDLSDLTGLALPTTSPYRLSGHMVRNGRKYALSDISGRVGMSDLEGVIKVDDTTGRPNLNADLRSRSLDYRDLGPLIGAPPPTGRNAEQQAEAARLAGSGRFLPDATWNVSRLRIMDATVRYRAASVAAPHHLPLRQVKLDATLNHGVLRIDPASFIMPHGELRARASVDARGPVAHNAIDLKVLNVRLEDLFGSKAGAQPALEGPLLARAVLRGDGNSVHKTAATANGTVSLVAPHGKVRKAFAELLGVNVANGLGLLWSHNETETGLRCAVGNFHAVNGRLHATTFVVDTDVVRADGDGTIDLNTEALNLELKGKPKKIRILHLSTPVAVTGHLRGPKFGLKPGMAPLQAAGAIALGVVLSPIAAILPFVDPGLSHDADCVGLTAAAQAKGAPVRPSQATAVPSKRR